MASTPTNGNDTIFGTPGPDNIDALGGNDKVLGGGGNDTLRGNKGNDQLGGEAGNDLVYGDAGNDSVRGGFGNDILYGGPGRDKFGFVVDSGFQAQTDTIKDFVRGEKIQLGSSRNFLFDYLDDDDNGVLDANDNNVFDYGVGLELDMTGAVGKTAILNVEKVEELSLNDFSV